MTDKTKKRARALQRKTGMKYEAALGMSRARKPTPPEVIREPFWDDHLADAVTHLRAQDDGNLSRMKMRTEVYSLRHVNVKVPDQNTFVVLPDPLFVTWVAEGDFWTLHETMRLSPEELFGQPLKKWLTDLGRHLGCTIFVKGEHKVNEKILDVDFTARVARRKLPPNDPVLGVLFDACKAHEMAPSYPFVSLEDFRHYVFGRSISKHSRVIEARRRLIDAAIVTATAGDLVKTQEHIKAAWFLTGPSLSQQMAEAARGMLKPSPLNQLARGIGESTMRSASQALKESFGTTPFEPLGRLKHENPLSQIRRVKVDSPLDQMGTVNLAARIFSQQEKLMKAMAPMQITQLKIHTTADLLKQMSPVNPAAEVQRQLRDLVFGPMDRIKAAVKASRPKRVRKPRPKKPPAAPPSAD